MPAVLTVLISFIKKFWLPIVLISVLFAGSLYIYNKGKRDCQAKMNQIIIEETMKREKEINGIDKKTNDIRNKLKDGLTDKKASCILSNNPFEVDCL